MPTTFEEARAITSIIDDYLTPEQAKERTTRLNEQVGHNTSNNSLRTTLDMLETLYVPRKMMSIKAKHMFLVAVTSFHISVILGNLIAAACLPFFVPWYIALPIVTLIMNLTFSPTSCPLTRLENRLRRSLQKPEIKHFVGHYLIWPVKKHLKKRKKATRDLSLS